MAACATAAFPAAAASWPERPLKIIVPYPPGGITDIVGRSIAERLSETLRQPVVVDNRAGAGGTIGASEAARATADGYTLFIGTSATNGTNPSTFKELRYKPDTDFAPVALLATAPLMIIVNPSVPAKTLPELVKYVKANPGKVNYASTGNGGSVHLTTELFALQTGTSLTHVVYKGSAPALNDLMGGHVQLMFDNVPSAAPLAAAGKVRALAVTSTKRTALAPDVPTVAETAVPNFESLSWIALYAPAGTPPAIVKQLNDAVNAGLKNAKLLTTFEKAGLDPVGGTPDSLARYQAAEIAKWADVVKTIKYVPE
ncbi:tripartite tricarboxylate transporter substrate binding protein [Ramlibacter sp. CrO1]|uniref:Tripartite tricarboxylate transporter substrate binding protein n=2 Tax=Ramlibacter algicola TaxID=2795217 RepID=A0A934Q282_9BURK|nr:tripartite tricarboxylate transporter substrate binding protein [Ramlibacter algicola]